MNKILVWDWPTRILHWAFAASLVAALGFGFLVKKSNPLFQFHMLFGIIALLLVLVRILLGVLGSRHARFANFPLRPREVVRYLGDAVTSKTKRYAGNNPGSALAAVAMLLAVPGLFFTGIDIGLKDADEVHETLAWVLAAVIMAHLAGLAWHTIRHRENIAMAMVSGRKVADPADGISSHHAGWGVALLVAGGAWIAALFTNHDSAAARVTLPGLHVTLPLGKAKSEKKKKKKDGKKKPKEEKHDND